MSNFFYMLNVMIPKIKGKYSDIDNLLNNLKWKLVKIKKNKNRTYKFKIKEIKYE